jgi:hypothetical protein
METTPLIVIDKTIGLTGRTGAPPVLTGYCAQRKGLFWGLGVVGKWTSTYMVLYICTAPSRVTRLIKAAPQLHRTEDWRWSMASCGAFGPRHRLSLAKRSHVCVNLCFSSKKSPLLCNQKLMIIIKHWNQCCVGNWFERLNLGFMNRFLWLKLKLIPSCWNLHQNWTMELVILVNSKPKPWKHIFQHKVVILR